MICLYYIMYSKIINPKTGKKVLTTSRLGKSILRNYLKVLNKQKGGAMTKFNPAMFTHMCDLGSVQCGAICANWLGVEKAFIRALLWESGSTAVIGRPKLAHSRGEWEKDIGISGEAMTLILQKHEDQIERGQLNKSLSGRGIRIKEFTRKRLSFIQFRGTLFDQFEKLLRDHIKPGYATILNIQVADTMGHYAIIGKFSDGRRFIIDPQHHTGIISDTDDGGAQIKIVTYIKSSWPSQSINIGIYINGVVLDATNYIPVDWDGSSFETERTYTPGYAALPSDMRICYFYDGTRGSCPYGSTCHYIHDDRFVHLRQQRPIRVCRHWLKGRCEKGARCEFRHAAADSDEDGAAAASAASSSAVLSKECSTCGRSLSREEFSNTQWRRSRGPRRCIQCEYQTRKRRAADSDEGGVAAAAATTSMAEEFDSEHLRQAIKASLQQQAIDASLRQQTEGGAAAAGGEDADTISIESLQRAMDEVLAEAARKEAPGPRIRKKRVQLRVMIKAGHPDAGKQGIAINFDRDKTWQVRLSDGRIINIHRGYLQRIHYGGNAEKSDYLKSLKELFKNHNNPEFISKVLPKLATMRIKLL